MPADSYWVAEVTPPSPLTSREMAQREPRPYAGKAWRLAEKALKFSAFAASAVCQMYFDSGDDSVEQAEAEAAAVLAAQQP